LIFFFKFIGESMSEILYWLLLSWNHIIIKFNCDWIALLYRF